MAKFDNIMKHVLTWEGGHSSDPDDNALKRGHSGVKGGSYVSKYKDNFIHTNRGVTWGTWRSYKNRIGKKLDGMEFVNMTINDWKKFAKYMFWNPYYLDNVKSQGVAEIIFDAYWGGGGSILVGQMQQYLTDKGYSTKGVDRAMGKNTAAAINKFTEDPTREKQLIKFLSDKRIAWLKTREDWGKYGKGWTNRVNAMYKQAINYITSNPVATAGIGLGTILLGAVVIFLITKNNA